MARRVDYTGQKFSRLTVLEMLSVEKGPSFCKCECECGKIHIVRSTFLKQGAVRSCGCLAKDKQLESVTKTKEKNKVGDITKSFFTAIVWNAKVREIPFDVSIEYIWQVYLNQNKKCAITGIEIYFGDRDKNNWTCSLDRIDNAKGYEFGNVRWVHKVINKMRNAMSDEEFINWCRLVVDHNNEV